MKQHKTKSNSYGFSQLELAIVVVAVVVVVVIGLFVWKNNSGPTLTSAQKTVQTACLKDYNDKKLCDFDALWVTSLGKTSYTMTLTGATSATFKADGKGNLSITTTSGDMVSYKGAVYVLSPGVSTWVEYPAGTSSAPTVPNLASSFPSISSEHAKGVKYVYDGTVSCGSLTCYKYQVKDPTQTGTTEFDLFDTQNYQLQSATTKDSSGTTNINMSYSAVTITAPTPAINYTDIQ